MPQSPMAAATVTAIGQYGVLSYAQARGCGLTKNDLQRLVRQGEWLHPHREVYVVRSLMPEAHSLDRLRCVALAAQLALGGRPRARPVGRRRGCGGCGGWSRGTGAWSTWPSRS